MTGAAGVAHSLTRAGVTRAFGIPAIESTLLFDALDASPIDVVLVTHEQNAAFMADAHARVTGELSACVLSPGQGLTKSVTGIAQARSDSSPMVVLVAAGTNPPTRPPALDPLETARPVCKRIYRLAEPEEVPAIMAQAVRSARSEEPGPVLVEIPLQVQRGRARMEGTGFRPGPRVMPSEAAERLDRAVTMIDRASQVGLYVGSGCFAALDELCALAERLDAPVATTISGLGALPWVHPLSVGFGPGPAGSPAAQEAFARCDVVLAVGCKFSEAATGGFSLKLGASLVHVDVAPHVAGCGPPTAVAVTAPAKLALRYLLDRVAGREHPGMRASIRRAKQRLQRQLEGRPEWTDAVDPVKFFSRLRELLSNEDVVVLDSGHHTYFGIASYPVHAVRTLVVPADFRAAGFAVPAAVAAQLTRPDARVVACLGDGGFLQTGLELLTARRCNVAPVVVVFADQQLGLVREFQQRVVGRETAVDLAPVSYRALAEAMDVKYVCIRRDVELLEGLKRALTRQSPTVVELRVAYREAAPYLRILKRLELKRLPRAAALRLGVRWLLRQILGR